MSQLSSDGGFLPPPRRSRRSQSSGVRARPARRARRRRLRCDIEVSFVGTVSPDHQQRIALLEAVAERYDLRLFGNPPRTLPASSSPASLLSGRSLGRRHVSGAAALEDHAQFPHRHGRARSREHAAVRGHRRRRTPAHRLRRTICTPCSRRAAKSPCGGPSTIVSRLSIAPSTTLKAAHAIAAAGQARTDGAAHLSPIAPPRSGASSKKLRAPR